MDCKRFMRRLEDGAPRLLVAMARGWKAGEGPFAHLSTCPGCRTRFLHKVEAAGRQQVRERRKGYRSPTTSILASLARLMRRRDVTVGLAESIEATALELLALDLRAAGCGKAQQEARVLRAVGAARMCLHAPSRLGISKAALFRRVKK